MNEESQAAKSTGPASLQPVFVLGVFRSGTSLLYSLLNQHPQMALMFECDVWYFPEALSKMRFKGAWLQRQEFFNKVLSRHRLNFSGSLRGLENIHTPDDLYRTFSDGKGSAFFGEKSPHYCARLRKLARRYPGASFILIWRDPVEIYRSVVRAARKQPYYRRRGFLSRLIFNGEKLIQAAAELDRAGVRLCHVTYASLIGDTGNTCRKICQFLGIQFDEKMLNLANADLSAVFPGPEHDHLRRRNIKRQQFAKEMEFIEPSVLKKLQRFDARWRRLQSQWLGNQFNSSNLLEPSLMERFYHEMMGSIFYSMGVGKRVLFEFLPLAWLQSYRQTKNWFLAQPSGLSANQPSIRGQFAAHWITILTSCVILLGLSAIHLKTGPSVMLLPFYLIPTAMLTLIINSRWGTLAAIASAVTWTALTSLWAFDHPNVRLHFGFMLWNGAMRFLVLQFAVVLLNRIRIETMKVASGRV
jgi:hypothetical protein